VLLLASASRSRRRHPPHRGIRLLVHGLTQRREAYYWATVFATFALGTALGDFTATSLNLGYLDSGILFTVIILIPAPARSGSLNSGLVRRAKLTFR